MYNDMSGPLSGMLTGTTTNAKVANDFLPAGQRPNKTPIFISGFTDTRAFLAWLQGILPRRSDGPIEVGEVDGRPINSRRVPRRCQCAAVP